MASITLKVLSGGAEGRVAAPDADVIRIGRAAESELALPDAHVAPLHARLHLGDAEVVLEAVEGSAGTWIERRGARFALGAERARCFIENGDVVELGAPGDAGTRVLVTVEPDRDRGRLLTLRPLAELGSSAVNEAERLRALLEALRRIGGADDLESATTALAEAALELVPRATHAAVTLRDEGNQGEVVTHGLSPVALRVRTASGEPAPPEAPFPIPRSILRRVSRERAAVLVANAPDEAMSSESLLGASIYSTMGVPLWKGDDLLGVLQVDSRGAPAMFGGTDLDVLGVLAANASLAIANARLIRRLSAAEQELKKENTFLRRRERTRSGDRRIVGESRVMQELFRKLDKVKDTRVSVLVQGETGTGKELVARA
ncbi:MAG: GAF domain-containing protein, partial [Pseudomonadota bacterium]